MFQAFFLLEVCQRIAPKWLICEVYRRNVSRFWMDLDTDLVTLTVQFIHRSLKEFLLLFNKFLLK